MLETSAVRHGRHIDWGCVEQWLRERLPARGIAGLDVHQPAQIEPCGGGHSNLTYLVRFGQHELIVRLPPFGPLPDAAHDMAREFRWLSAVHPVFPLAPQPHLLCDDAGVAGAIFYAMERRCGIVVHGDEPAPIKGDPSLRRRVGIALVDTLASLHRIDPGEAGLTHLGRPAGFVARQVRRWSERWQQFKTVEVPELDALALWLRERIPPDPDRPGIVHGDYKLDNVMLDTVDPSRVVAVFDWEMSALGEPLIDLAMLLAYWVPSAPPDRRDAFTTVTDRPGWLTREEIIERYAERSHRSVDTLPYFEAFAFFKFAVLLQQIYWRYVNGQTDDARFAAFGDRVVFLARAASRLVERL